MQFPIIIGLRRSRLLTLALVSTTLLACGVTLALPGPVVVQASSFLLILIVACLAWQRLGAAIAAIRLEQAGQILVALAGDTAFIEAELLPGTSVHPWLTVVRLKTQGQRPHLLIAAVDTMKPEEFRRLRVYLRWRAEVSAVTDDS